MARHLAYDLLNRLVEQRASPVDDARARRHLMSCARCRSELAWLERIHGMSPRVIDLGPAQSLVPRWQEFEHGPSARAPETAPYWQRTWSPQLG